MMNKFWPSRPVPEGFSIEKLARISRERMSNKLNILDSDPQENIDLPFRENVSGLPNQYHWANRCFNEYHDAA